jgi:hypothetical protein
MSTTSAGTIRSLSSGHVNPDGGSPRPIRVGAGSLAPRTPGTVRPSERLRTYCHEPRFQTYRATASRQGPRHNRRNHPVMVTSPVAVHSTFEPSYSIILTVWGPAGSAPGSIT